MEIVWAMLCSVMTLYLMEWTVVSNICFCDMCMTALHGGGGRAEIAIVVSPNIPCMSLLHSFCEVEYTEIAFLTSCAISTEE
jgi:hypothetical protein